jgi:hypothetical protein
MNDIKTILYNIVPYSLNDATNIIVFEFNLDKYSTEIDNIILKYSFGYHTLITKLSEFIIEKLRFEKISKIKYELSKI